jgi:hypothetical protein
MASLAKGKRLVTRPAAADCHSFTTSAGALARAVQARKKILKSLGKSTI